MKIALISLASLSHKSSSLSSDNYLFIIYNCLFVCLFHQRVTEAGLASATLDPEDRRYIYAPVKMCIVQQQQRKSVSVEVNSLGEGGGRKKNNEVHKKVKQKGMKKWHFSSSASILSSSPVLAPGVVKSFLCSTAFECVPRVLICMLEVLGTPASLQ